MASSDELRDESGTWLRTGGAWNEDLEQRFGAALGDEPLRVGQRVGHIRIDGILGSGGMGTVYLGFDERLEREVAVKSVHLAPRLGVEAKRRFEREAKVLSRLNHPAICQIYSLVEGEMPDGRPLQCLVLERVEGETLGEALPRLASDRVLEILEQIARALAVAHAEGIVHRDLKPDNVMLTPAGEVKILDFGIARIGDAGGPRPDGGEEPVVAQDGTRLLGTPRYRSPEQALAEPLSPASDLYAFGLLSSEAVTGRPVHPESSSGYELIRRAAEAVVEPLGTGVDPEIAGLISDLLARDPAKRPSAEDAAHRLRRVVERPLRRRRRRLAGWLAALVVLALGAAAWAGADAWRARRDGERQAVAARRLGEEVRAAEALLRVSRLAPPHDEGLARRTVEERLQQMEKAFGDAGRWARGPLSYAQGRLWLALGDAGGARDALEAAWAQGYRGAEVAEALGLAYGSLFDEAASEALRQATEDQRRAALAEASSTLRRPAVEWLRRSRDLYPSSPGPSSSADLLTAWIALYEERFADARVAADAVFAAAPWHYEALHLHSLASRGEARTEVAAGRSQEALEDLFSAESALDRALEVARSDAGLHLERCRLAEEIIRRSRAVGGDTNAPYQRAVTACRRARDLLPGSAEPWIGEARIEYFLAWSRLQDRRNPEEAIDRMATAAREALDRAHDSAEVHRLLGMVASHRAQWASIAGDAGGTPAREYLEQALAALRRAAELDPASSNVYYSLGLAHFDLGFESLAAGEDPRRHLKDASLAFAEAQRLAPTSTSAASMMGSSYGVMAMYALERGLDPLGHLEMSIESFERVLDVDPGEPAARGNLGLAYRDLATYHWRVDGDSDDTRDALEKGRRTMAELLADKSDSAASHITLAELELIRARVLIEAGEDPAPALDSVDEQVEALAALGAEGNDGARLETVALLLRACGSDRKQASPRADELSRRAGEVVRGWLERGGGYLARLRRVEVEWCRAKAGLDAAAADRGLALLEELLAERSDDGEALLLRARMLRVSGAEPEKVEAALGRAELANPWLAREAAGLRSGEP